ncbi:MAG TPA: hypothetical protein VIN40_06710 [Candidatus Tyrphobacter sp.]
MTRRFPLGLAIFIFAVIALTVSWHYFGPRELGPKERGKVIAVRNAPSDLYASLTVRYEHPPIYREFYEMRDRNGISSFAYVVQSYTGKQITVKAPPQAIYDVSFFFGELVNDGVWEIPNRPPRGNTSVRYTITVRQTEDYQSGSRSTTFTDPHYWATSAGREYHIRLSPTGPEPNLLQLQGTRLRDPRYQQIVDDFHAFGSEAFRSSVASARASVRRAR